MNEVCGLVLAGGKSSRFGLESPPKYLSPFGNVLLIENSIRRLIQSNISSLCIVAREPYLNEVQSLIAKYTEEFSRIEVVTQKQGRGLIGGLLAGLNSPNVSGSKFVYLMLSDEIVIDPNLNAVKSNAFKKYKAYVGFENTETLTDVSETYSLPEGQQSVFVEKPLLPKEFRRGTGNILFELKALIECLRSENVKELVDILNYFLKKESALGYFEVGKKYFNINTKKDLFVAEKFLKESGEFKCNASLRALINFQK